MRVVVTGSSGTVGSVLMNDLGYDMHGISLRKSKGGCSVERLIKEFEGAHTVLHCAWNTRKSNANSYDGDYYNIHMAHNVLVAAEKAGVEKVAMWSSVHRDRFWRWFEHGTPSGVMLPDTVYFGPAVPYGMEKLHVEFLTRMHANNAQYAAMNILLGGFNGGSTPSTSWHSRQYLSRRDFLSLIRCFINERPVQKCFNVYAISDNEDRVHDWSNHLGWAPQDRAPALTTSKDIPHAFVLLDERWDANKDTKTF